MMIQLKMNIFHSHIKEKKNKYNKANKRNKNIWKNKIKQILSHKNMVFQIKIVMKDSNRVLKCEKKILILIKMNS